MEKLFLHPKTTSLPILSPYCFTIFCKRMICCPSDNHKRPSCNSHFPPISLNLGRSSFPLNESIAKTSGVFSRRRPSIVSYAGSGGFLAVHNLQRIAALSSLVLMISKGTVINKSFIVPLFALVAPSSVISWTKGSYGVWTAFLGLLVRLFFFLPGELELPLMALLLIIAAPYQVLELRGTQAGVVIAMLIACYMGFQHFSWARNLERAFEYRSIVATAAIISVIISCVCFLI